MALRIIRRRQPILGGIPPYSFRRVRPAIITPTLGRFPGRVYAFRVPSPGGGAAPATVGPPRVTIISRQAVRPLGRVITSRAIPPTIVIPPRMPRTAIVGRPLARFTGRVIGGRVTLSAGSRLPKPVIVSRSSARFTGRVLSLNVRTGLVPKRLAKPVVVYGRRPYPLAVYGMRSFRVPGPSLFGTMLIMLSVSASDDGFELSGGEG